MSLWKEIRLSRQEIYDRVWANPIREVARELGISDVGLGKLCRRSGIPIPPQGFHLKSPGRLKDRLVIALPADQDNTSRIFDFRVPAAEILDAKEQSKTQLNTLRASAPAKLPPDRLKELESRLAVFRRKLNPKHLDDRGVMISPSVNFAIRVAPASFDRAVQLLRSLAVRILTLGGRLHTKEGSVEDSLCLRWEGYDFTFQIDELSARQEIPPDRRRARISGIEFPNDAWRLVPTGKLTLEGRGPGYARLALRDGRAAIEERLEELVERMYEHVVAQREEDRIKAIREERTVAHLLKKDEVRRRVEYEERCHKQLHAEARQFRQAQALRQYVEAVEAAGYSESNPNFPSSDAWRDWITRGKAHIASLNPITSNRAGILPPYPEPKEITEFPAIYLRFDTPEEAEAEIKRSPWAQW